MALTPLVWGWMFGIGILAVKYFDILQQHHKLLLLASVPLLAIAWFGGEGAFLGSSGNRLGLLYYVCYVSLIVWIAFALPYYRLSCDLSYGIYIWHMPIVNALLWLKFESVSLVLVLTVVFAAISWFLVERPMLRRKQISLKPL